MYTCICDPLWEKVMYIYKLRYTLTHNRPFHVEKVKNYCIFKICFVLYCIFDFYFFSNFIQRDGITGTCPLLGGINVSFSASSFNEARHFKGCFLCYVNKSSWKLSICKCVITCSISITVRATKLKLMLPAINKTQF